MCKLNLKQNENKRNPNKLTQYCMQMFIKLCCKNHVSEEEQGYTDNRMHCSTDASKYPFFEFSLFHFCKSYEKELLSAPSYTTDILYTVLDCGLCINR